MFQAGLGILFTAPDLSGMLDTSSGTSASMVIARVVHKAQIEVNQVGAEAAAATGMYWYVNSST